MCPRVFVPNWNKLGFWHVVYGPHVAQISPVSADWDRAWARCDPRAKRKWRLGPRLVDMVPGLGIQNGSLSHTWDKEKLSDVSQVWAEHSLLKHGQSPFLPAGVQVKIDRRTSDVRHEKGTFSAFGSTCSVWILL